MSYTMSHNICCIIVRNCILFIVVEYFCKQLQKCQTCTELLILIMWFWLISFCQLSDLVICVSDLDTSIDSEELALPHDSEMCDHYEEELQHLEKVFQQTAKNLQRYLHYNGALLLWWIVSRYCGLLFSTFYLKNT